MLPSWRRSWFRAQWWALPAIVTLCTTLPKIGQGAFRSDTGWYAAIALHGWRSGELWSLHAGPETPFFNKPPLALWIHGLALWLAGPQLWAARLPSVLAMVACVLLAAAIARRLCGRRVALAVGLILALTPEMVRASGAISLDLWQLLFMLLATLLVVVGAQRDARGPVALAGVPIGLALLCKPLVALLAPVLLAIWLLVIGRRRLLVASAMSVILAGLIAAPWHLSMLSLHGAEFARQYFGNQVLDRAAARLDNVGHAGEPWYYLRKLAKSYWPWLPVLAVGLALAARGRFGRDRAAIALAGVWAGGWLLALSLFADRRPRYALPLYPMLALPAALALVRSASPSLRTMRRGIAAWIGPVALVGAIVIAMAPLRAHRGEHKAWLELFEWLQAEGVEDLWQGGFDGARSARLYLESGQWPRATQDPTGRIVHQPPARARIIYHWRDGLAPGSDERIIFESEAAILRITELERTPWDPRDIDDPGEDALDYDDDDDDTDPA